MDGEKTIIVPRDKFDDDDDDLMMWNRFNSTANERKMLNKLRSPTGKRRIISVTCMSYVGKNEHVVRALMKLPRLKHVYLEVRDMTVEQMERLARHPALEEALLVGGNLARIVPFASRMKRLYLRSLELTNYSFADAIAANPHLTHFGVICENTIGFELVLPHLVRAMSVFIETYAFDEDLLINALAKMIENGRRSIMSFGFKTHVPFTNTALSDALERFGGNIAISNEYSGDARSAHERGILRQRVLTFSCGLSGHTTTPHSTFLRKDGDTAISHTILRFLI